MKKLFIIMLVLLVFAAACAALPFSANLLEMVNGKAASGDDSGAGGSAAIELENGIASLRITIDPGHGGIDSGAVGTDTGVQESELNLEVSELVAEKFRKAGADVLMTRTTADVDYTGEGETPKMKDMNRRARLVTGQNPHVLVSIHMNMFTDRNVSGAQVFYQQGSSGGEDFARSIQDELNTGLNKENGRTVQAGDYFMTKAAKGPSVIVECGFLSNHDEETRLTDPLYQQKLADCIFRGVCKYLGVK